MRPTAHRAIVLLLGVLLMIATGAAHAEAVRLAAGGQALMPVVIAPDASERVQAAAADLAEYLGRIAGAQFEITTGDDEARIVLGTAAQFPALAAEADFSAI